MALEGGRESAPKAYPHSGQPFLKSAGPPECPQDGHLTDEKNFPQCGQTRSLPFTSVAQYSQ